jgi:flagellar biosynthesis/type III secretory pathway chaperone
MEKINLNKQVFTKSQFNNTINTEFTQLVSSTTTPTGSNISVDQFFQEYQALFYQIPKLGETNSHEYLVKTSSEYIGSIELNDTIQALIDEVTQLRQENLELQQTIASNTLAVANQVVQNSQTLNV